MIAVVLTDAKVTKMDAKVSIKLLDVAQYMAPQLTTAPIEQPTKKFIIFN